MITTTPSTSSLFSSLDDLLNQQHPLFKLSEKINRSVFEDTQIRATFQMSLLLNIGERTPLYQKNTGKTQQQARIKTQLLFS
jgi:hypothetical protein